MTRRATRCDWLIFLALGFIWGSSTCSSSWRSTPSGRSRSSPCGCSSARRSCGSWCGSRTLAPDPPDLRPPAGHGRHQHRHPVHAHHLGRAVGRQALAAILNSTVPLFVLVIAPMFLPDEPIRVNGVVGLVVGFVGVIVSCHPDSPTRTATRRARSPCSARRWLRHRQGVRPAQRAGPGAADPGRVPGHLRACSSSARSRSSWSARGRRPARRPGVVLGHLAGDLRIGLAYLGVVPAARRVGRDADRAGRLPAAGRRIVLGYLVLRSRSTVAPRSGPRSSSAASRWSTGAGVGAGCTVRRPRDAEDRLTDAS